MTARTRAAAGDELDELLAVDEPVPYLLTPAAEGALIGGRPGSGKSFALRLLAVGYALNTGGQSPADPMSGTDPRPTETKAGPVGGAA